MSLTTDFRVSKHTIDISAAVNFDGVDPSFHGIVRLPAVESKSRFSWTLLDSLLLSRRVLSRILVGRVERYSIVSPLSYQSPARIVADLSLVCRSRRELRAMGIMNTYSTKSLGS
jgi:hypothetical protein